MVINIIANRIQINTVKNMKEQILKIAKDLEQGNINENNAQALLLGLFDVSTHTFNVGDNVKWRGMNLVVVKVGIGEILIATSENVEDENYIDWWVGTQYVCQYDAISSKRIKKMEQSKQEKEIYELAELLMQSENLEASATILRDFAEKCYDVNKRLNKVHVIIKSESVDYHGCYDEIVEIYDNIEDAEKKKKELLEENNNCNIDYFIDTYNVICR